LQALTLRKVLEAAAGVLGDAAFTVDTDEFEGEGLSPS
jgi:hypothetical protein